MTHVNCVKMSAMTMLLISSNFELKIFNQNFNFQLKFNINILC